MCGLAYERLNATTMKDKTADINVITRNNSIKKDKVDLAHHQLAAGAL